MTPILASDARTPADRRLAHVDDTPEHQRRQVQGRIVRSGTKGLALELEEKGYESYEEVKSEVSEPAMA